MKSERAKSSGSSTSSTPSERARSAGTKGSWPSSSISKGARAPRDLRSDASQADDAERPARELDALQPAALPGAAAQARVALRDVARDGEHQPEGVLGRGDGVGERRVDDGDAALGRRLHVDVVDADAGARDHPQVAGPGEGGAGHARLAADDEGGDAGERLGQLRLGEAGADLHLVRAPQEVDAGVGDAVQDEDARHGPGP